jgi:hypothetical protein
VPRETEGGGGSARAHLNSTLPTAVEGSMGVKMKWFLGEATTTS